MHETHHPQDDYGEVTGVILAGGRSRRMGRDKATLVVGGRTLFARTLAMLRPLFARVLISGDRPDLVLPGVPCAPDVYPGSALGGLHGALHAAATDWICVVPCDLADPDPDLVRRLLALRAECDLVVPRTPGGVEPVFALYHKNCLPPMQAMLERGDYRILDFYSRVRVRYLDLSQCPGGLHNLNTPEDLRRLTQGGSMPAPVVSIVAKSGTGKTTLLEKLIAELRTLGYRVGAIKHGAHSFSTDHAGKDS